MNGADHRRGLNWLARRSACGVAAGLGLLVDRALGEPPVRCHPVVWFGRAMTTVEGQVYRDVRTSGLAYNVAGVALGAGIGLGLQRVIGRRASVVAATALAVGGRMLDDEATGIAHLLEQGDLAGARLALRALVGRRTEDLSEAEVVRAVIESVAENTVDAVTAPLWWATLGGAPWVAAYRAVNTMDAMVGHRTPRYQRFGWASARLDDAANLVPARLTAAVLMAPLLLRPPPTLEIDPEIDRAPDGPPDTHTAEPDRDLGRASTGAQLGLLAQFRSEAGRHPSPNGGWVEAAFAHRLGVVLGGVNHYADATEDRGRLGHGRAPTRADIHRAVALRRQAASIVAIVLTLLPAVTSLALRRTTRPAPPARRRPRTKRTKRTKRTN
ncbi:MAG: cobalamin biosynthesis protein [Acidimicrobiales bacterium]